MLRFLSDESLGYYLSPFGLGQSRWGHARTVMHCAYEDPAIKSIWNGTLEFPISFAVYMRTQAQ